MARACVPGASARTASLAWFPQGCAPPGHFVSIFLEVTGLFTRPLFPAAKGHQCQQVLFTDSVTKGPCGASYPTGPWAWSVGPCRAGCSPGQAPSGPPGFVTCAVETFTPTSCVSPGSDGSHEVVLISADTLGAAPASTPRHRVPRGVLHVATEHSLLGSI